MKMTFKVKSFLVSLITLSILCCIAGSYFLWFRQDNISLLRSKSLELIQGVINGTMPADDVEDVLLNAANTYSTNTIENEIKTCKKMKSRQECLNIQLNKILFFASIDSGLKRMRLEVPDYHKMDKEKSINLVAIFMKDYPHIQNLKEKVLKYQTGITDIALYKSFFEDQYSRFFVNYLTDEILNAASTTALRAKIYKRPYEFEEVNEESENKAYKHILKMKSDETGNVEFQISLQYKQLPMMIANSMKELNNIVSKCDTDGHCSIKFDLDKFNQVKGQWIFDAAPDESKK